MFRLFLAVGIVWAVALGLDLWLAPHDVAAHWFTALWVTIVLSGLPIAWRWLERYKATASIAARLDAAEGRVWAKVALHFEGAKTAILMAIVSAFTTAKDWAGSLAHTLFGLQPGDLDPFKDSTLLHTFFSDAVALKAIAGVTLFAAFLSIKTHLNAAAIVPAPGTAAPTPPAAAS